MATLEQLETGLKKAYDSGNMEYARILGAEIVKARGSKVNQIPGGEIPGTASPDNKQAKIDKTMESVGGPLVGTVEAGATLLTGIPAGLAGLVDGTQGVLDSIRNGTFGTPEGVKAAEAKAAEAMQRYTYVPRTPSGQEQVKAIGEVAQNVLPVAPLAQAAAITQAAKPAVAQAVQGAKQAGGKALTVGKQTAAQIMPGNGSAGPAAAISIDAATPTPGTMGSAGAAATDMATLRQARADSLPVPIKLTKGQRERTFEQQRFERETAKDAETGAPLRQRFEEQNRQIFQNFDAWLDQTGAEAPSLRDTGVVVTKAIKTKADGVKAKIRDLYKKAEEAGELENPITLDTLVQHINESAPEASTAPILDVARRKLLQIGAVTEGEAGQLIPLEIPLKKAEMVRQAISRATNYEPTNIRQGSIMKGLIDQQTEGLGGNLYKQARRVRAQFAREFENRAVISDLLNNKRGMDDRKVAFEDVHKRAVLDGSLDDVRMVRRTLQTQGEEGMQAWRELQGQTVNYIKEQTFGNVARDSTGAPTASPAKLDKVIKQLDKDGKLDFVFGKQGAQQLRDINDIAKDVLTVPANAVNTSNTASVLLTALDTMATFGTTGVPVPAIQALKAISKNVKQRKTRKQVQDALK
jgi:enamine deaminase RidA (YjgF/YER057c/UK114 family)